MLARLCFLVIGCSLLSLSLIVMPARADDCNENGIDDVCDLSCAGECAGVSGCGQSLDCNSNGIPDECDILNTYIGTQGGTGTGRVYRYLDGGSWEDLTPSPAWDVAAVMDLVQYNGHLYAGVQTAHGQGGGGGSGQVWRYDGGQWQATTWRLVACLE